MSTSTVPDRIQWFVRLFVVVPEQLSSRIIFDFSMRADRNQRILFS